MQDRGRSRREVECETKEGRPDIKKGYRKAINGNCDTPTKQSFPEHFTKEFRCFGPSEKLIHDPSDNVLIMPLHLLNSELKRLLGLMVTNADAY